MEPSASFCTVVNRSSPSPRHASTHFPSSCLVSHMSPSFGTALPVGKCSCQLPSGRSTILFCSQQSFKQARAPYDPGPARTPPSLKGKENYRYTTYLPLLSPLTERETALNVNPVGMTPHPFSIRCDFFLRYLRLDNNRCRELVEDLVDALR